ncbi:hypothetical protein BpHYR1_041858 [Brachionus plicatilis]|uniref:Uncharacterized protein n=1 Tax=Brachionus plicatilis TaxID=10195 RepID=A0A3M7Q380_BRAPC|nr:hypothetical protein BpHYR1_041858 [Brachionus plicatilis]
MVVEAGGPDAGENRLVVVLGLNFYPGQLGAYALGHVSVQIGLVVEHVGGQLVLYGLAEVVAELEGAFLAGAVHIYFGVEVGVVGAVLQCVALGLFVRHVVIVYGNVVVVERAGFLHFGVVVVQTCVFGAFECAGFFGLFGKAQSQPLARVGADQKVAIEQGVQ